MNELFSKAETRVYFEQRNKDLAAAVESLTDEVILTTEL